MTARQGFPVRQQGRIEHQKAGMWQLPFATVKEHGDIKCGMQDGANALAISRPGLARYRDVARFKIKLRLAGARKIPCLKNFDNFLPKVERSRAIDSYRQLGGVLLGGFGGCNLGTAGSETISAPI